MQTNEISQNTVVVVVVSNNLIVLISALLIESMVNNEALRGMIVFDVCLCSVCSLCILLVAVY